MVLGRPAAHVGADLSDQLQRGLRPDGMDLAQVSTASEHMQRSADVEGWRVLLGLGAWHGQRGGGWRLLGGEQVEQRLDLGVAFGDLLEVELVSREVLPHTEQVFLAIVAGAATSSWCEAWQRPSRWTANRSGSRAPARMAWMILSPVTPVMSLTTVWSIRFISVNAFCMRWMRAVSSSTRIARGRRYERSGTIAAAGRKLARNSPTLWSCCSHSQSLTWLLRPRTLCTSRALTSTTSKPRCSRIEGNPVDPGRFHRHGLHPALRQPLCQALQIGGEGAELADRLGVAFGRHRHEMTFLSAIDAGGIGLDAFEQRD